ncbi:hypothetical protein QR680_009547 [Steinernema hermaphroditum]|uniref:glucuronosyltransferase n=1 Tax=Steinernema hermaphroditum TaxID=289476 RepID=A0AA39IN78_9BILA|nr:hypothetical protein QR680_009547 [Steinernema hermaphroditum]
MVEEFFGGVSERVRVLSSPSPPFALSSSVSAEASSFKRLDLCRLLRFSPQAMPEASRAVSLLRLPLITQSDTPWPSKSGWGQTPLFDSIWFFTISKFRGWPTKSQMKHFVASCLLSACLCFWGTVVGSHVALFPSSGCFSHTKMMIEVGEDFAADNVSWVQIFMFDFGFRALTRLPESWRQLVMDEADAEGSELIREGGTLLWSLNVPVDQDRLWDVRGSVLFFKLLRRNQRLCSKLLGSAEFQRFKERNDVDLVVVDHFIQECFTSLASLLNATTVQFSNWPIADGYVSALNLPAPPSSVPKTGTAFSSLGMSFFDRVRNTLFHSLIVFARSVQTAVINHFYSNHGFALDLYSVEASHLFYVGRSEFLAEPLRPLSNRIKHFGCASCKSPEEYLTSPPRNPSAAPAKRERVVEGPRLPNGSIVLCGERVDLKDLAMAELRHTQMAIDFPEIEFGRLDRSPFVLVSFGSVAQLENMPKALLLEFLQKFSELPYTVVWQTNSPAAKTPKDVRIPANVVLVRWAPIKNLLAHRNLHFVICHGGVNTINELLLFGVPVLGVPLQGDQSSNLQRLVDFGMALLVDVKAIAAGGLRAKLQEMELHYDRIAARARLFSSMVRFHRGFTTGSQKFWLNWARRHGAKLRGRRLVDLHFRGSLEYFAFFECLGSATVLLLLIRVLSS